jgi:hypothetical protein
MAKRCIPLSADAIRGSHGLVDAGGKGWGVFIGAGLPKGLAGRKGLRAVEVAHLLL